MNAVGGWSGLELANCTVNFGKVNNDEIGAEQVAGDD